MEAKVTVIIPSAPHHEHLLERAVASVKAQTVPVEVLTYIDHERRGPAYGRNLMAKQVKTDFIVTLDADDYLAPTFVERTLAKWQPGSYVYTDWYQPLADGGLKYVKAISCCIAAPRPGEATFHLASVLIPTSFWLRLGGQDETVFGGEDTDFFWRANAEGIRSIVLREPLYYYTPDGNRARESRANPEWDRLLKTMFAKYKDSVNMGCCGEIMPKELYQQKETDILVRPKAKAAQKYKGEQSGRDYGRISRSKVLYIDPADFRERLFEKVTDWQGTSPVVESARQIIGRTPKQEAAMAERNEAARKAAEFMRTGAVAAKGEPSTVQSKGLEAGRVPANYELSAEGVELTDPTEVDRLIRKLGTRLWTGDGRYVVYGYDMQQNATELAEFIAWLYQTFDFEDRAPRLLEIGAGESAGLARFFSLLGWQVVSVEPAELKLDAPIDAWQHVQAKSTAVDDTGPLAGEFDVVFIDGDPALRGKDWERFLERASVVAAHDIAPEGYHPEVAEWWNGLSKGPKGGFKKGYREFVAEPENGAKALGIGVFSHE